MKIALVRHGETEENHSGRIQGRSNHLLNDIGRGQCQELRDKIKEKHFDICYMSPLLRTVETAFIIIGDTVPTVVDDRIIERDMGELEGHPREEYNSFEYWDYELNKSEKGVESVQDLFKRSEDFLNYIMEKNKGQDILIVTHSAVYRALRYLIQKHPLKGKLMDGYIKNCQYEEFEI